MNTLTEDNQQLAQSTKLTKLNGAITFAQDDTLQPRAQSYKTFVAVIYECT
jgi:hypothetical protein